jgi:RNA polymerase sigma-70 factor (ECF subfamily)
MKNAYFIALGLVGNRDDALELSQEAFILAYRNIKQLKPDRKFFPWFYQILRNVCFSHLRKIRNRRTHSLEKIEEQMPVAEVDDSFTPDVVAERNESKDQVWKAIGKLNKKHREVIILRHFQNLSYEQMAQNLFCSRGTVMSRLYYARKRLKELLSTEKGGD